EILIAFHHVVRLRLGLLPWVAGPARVGFWPKAQLVPGRLSGRGEAAVRSGPEPSRRSHATPALAQPLPSRTRRGLEARIRIVRSTSAEWFSGRPETPFDSLMALTLLPFASLSEPGSAIAPGS